MITALVTGGNGFIGRYIVEQLLQRGDRVRVIGRGAYPELRAMGVDCFRADLAAQDDCAAALRGCDVVFHVAARAGIWGDVVDFYRANVIATQHMLRSAARADAPRFVYTSSPSVAIGEADLEGVDESTPFPPRYLAPYPWSKAIAERWVLRQRDILTTAIRPHLVWGPRDPHILPRLLDRARGGRLRQIGDGSNLVDVTYVENAAEAHLQAADALNEGGPVRGRAYFIGQEQPVNLWHFINRLVTGAGAPPISKRIGGAAAFRIASLLEAAYRAAGSTREPPLTRLTVAQMAHAHWFDHSAAQRDFGYGPRIGIEEGLRRTWAAL